MNTGTSWISFWSDEPPLRTFSTHALTTARTAMQTTPWCAARSSSCPRGTIVARSKGILALMSASWASQTLWSSLLGGLRLTWKLHRRETLPWRSGLPCGIPCTAQRWPPLGERPWSHTTGLTLNQPQRNLTRPSTAWPQRKPQAVTGSPPTWSSTAWLPYCFLCMKSSASAGKKGLLHKTWGMPRSSPSTKTKASVATVTTTEAFPLLGIVGKIFARVILVHLQKLAERVYPESQCGFRAARSTVDMVFSLRQLQENCRDSRCPCTSLSSISRRRSTLSA